MLSDTHRMINMWGDGCVNSLGGGHLFTFIHILDQHNVQFEYLTILCQFYLNKSEILKQILLLNQVHLPDAQQAKHWDAKFAAEKGLFMKKPSAETGKQITHPPSGRWGAQVIYRIKKQGDLRHEERWLVVGEMWGHQCSSQVYLDHRLLWEACS